ncbi:MAG: hypothetical protein A2172_04100 [Candidatus Woykebacteria bacterium RBG_13_40_15]|uniref:Late embryogenesis abundant protein LEA-2 subgroup domain-containing protein n=1 Tax=Candidatus Woykebacteria bacterium RBG_13_40_15 TaxID=1802593 RepID=A0A1G1W6U3_9BACT|nr:MAG: hypothetical protein A2172_04100 [Candidatus Woykebacteria bacterium RBG_13_40_15]
MKTIINIFKSLQPIFLISIIVLVLAAIFFSYDQYATFKENKLADSLTGNLVLKSSCKTIVNEGAKFDLKFTLENKNNVPIKVEQFGIDQNFLGQNQRKFMDLVSSSPKSIRDGSENQYLLSNFQSVVEVAASSKKDFTFTMQAATRTKAGAKPATILVYKGKVMFSLEHGITAEAPCEIQIRYSK